MGGEVLREYVVYRHIFPNGKNYIGVTCVVPYTRRWRAGSSYKKQEKMYRAIQKYGWDNIQHEIVCEGLTRTKAAIMEQELISVFDSVRNGYNVSTGGGGTYGIPCSPNTKAKISAANTGKVPSEKSRHNLDDYRNNHGAWNKGGHLTPEQYRKIAGERKQRCNRAITAFDPVSFAEIAHFVSASEAAKHFGVSKNVISRCANGGRKTSAGFVWRYDNASF